MRVFDTFTFNNELELLDLRLNILNDTVDYFVIIEARNNFYGEEKELFYLKNKERFKKFEHKILHIILSKFDFFNPFQNDAFQKNMSFTSIKNILKDDDIFMYSDVDEIPNPEIIKKFKASKPKKIWRLTNQLNFYYLNVRVKNDVWYGTLISFKNNISNFYLKNKELENSKPAEFGIFNLRLYSISENKYQPETLKTTDFIEDGGWHYTYFPTKEKGIYTIYNKLQKHTHKELTVENIANIDHIQDCLKNLKLIIPKETFGEGMPYWELEKFDITEENTHKYIINNIDQYKHLVYN